jgi:hypothetical protein
MFKAQSSNCLKTMAGRCCPAVLRCVRNERHGGGPARPSRSRKAVAPANGLNRSRSSSCCGDSAVSASRVEFTPSHVAVTAFRELACTALQWCRAAATLGPYHAVTARCPRATSPGVHIIRPSRSTPRHTVTDHVAASTLSRA